MVVILDHLINKPVGEGRDLAKASTLGGGGGGGGGVSSCFDQLFLYNFAQLLKIFPRKCCRRVAGGLEGERVIKKKFRKVKFQFFPD